MQITPNYAKRKRRGARQCSTRHTAARVDRHMTRNIRPIRIEGQVAFVPLTKGLRAIIDAADVHLVDGFYWRAMVNNRSIYAARKECSEGKHKVILLHRFIMAADNSTIIDHINGDGLDCRRCNMRHATASQNSCNQRIRVDNSSGYKGVWRDQRGKKWRSKIKIKGVVYGLGSFETPESAHAAYCKASERLHGEFGRSR